MNENWLLIFSDWIMHQKLKLISSHRQSKDGGKVYSQTDRRHKVPSWDRGFPGAPESSSHCRSVLRYSLCWVRGPREPHGGKYSVASSSGQEFVIDTPCEDAQKMYIGNAMDGSCAVVFAQLVIEGKSQGLLPTWKNSLCYCCFPIRSLHWKCASQGQFYLVKNMCY